MMSDQARKTCQLKRYHDLLGQYQLLILHLHLWGFFFTLRSSTSSKHHTGETAFILWKKCHPLRAFTLHLHLHEDIFAPSWYARRHGPWRDRIIIIHTTGRSMRGQLFRGGTYGTLVVDSHSVIHVLSSIRSLPQPGEAGTWKGGGGVSVIYHCWHNNFARPPYVCGPEFQHTYC